MLGDAASSSTTRKTWPMLATFQTSAGLFVGLPGNSLWYLGAFQFVEGNAPPSGAPCPAGFTVLTSVTTNPGEPEKCVITDSPGSTGSDACPNTTLACARTATAAASGLLKRIGTSPQIRALH